MIKRTKENPRLASFKKYLEQAVIRGEGQAGRRPLPADPTILDVQYHWDKGESRDQAPAHVFVRVAPQHGTALQDSLMGLGISFRTPEVNDPYFIFVDTATLDTKVAEMREDIDARRPAAEKQHRNHVRKREAAQRQTTNHR